MSDDGERISLPIVGDETGEETGEETGGGSSADGEGGSEGGVLERIDGQVSENEVVLYMKGDPRQPMCGFSARASGVLEAYGVSFESVNVLEDDAIREGIKEYGDWPTIPQLYVQGELVGGSDIIMKMHESGELADLFDEQDVEFEGP